MANWTKFEGDGTQVQKSIMDLIQCKICCEIIENPKALPCLHTYCLDCLQEWIHGTAAKIICPECKESFVLPTQGVLGLPSNFFVAKLREEPVVNFVNLYRQRHIKCGLCKQLCVLDLTGENMDYQNYVCRSCLETCITDSNELECGNGQTAKVSLFGEQCPKHRGQIVNYFCETCGVMLCHHCIVLNHPEATCRVFSMEPISMGKSQDIKEHDIVCEQVVEEKVQC